VAVSGAPYDYRNGGVYVATGTYAGSPLYTFTDVHGLTWSLYRRQRGYWVLDFNRADEQWAGTVAYAWPRGSSVTDAPRWSTSTMRVVTATALPPSPPPPSPNPPPPPSPSSNEEPTPVYASGAIPYASRTVGEYAPSGRVFGGSPVYTRTDRWGLVWSLYRRSAGYWVFDFNSVDDTWGGTIAYTSPSSNLLTASWNRAITISTNPPANMAAWGGETTSGTNAGTDMALPGSPTEVQPPTEQTTAEPAPEQDLDATRVSELQEMAQANLEDDDGETAGSADTINKNANADASGASDGGEPAETAPHDETAPRRLPVLTIVVGLGGLAATLVLLLAAYCCTCRRRAGKDDSFPAVAVERSESTKSVGMTHSSASKTSMTGDEAV